MSTIFAFCAFFSISQLHASQFWDDYLTSVEQRFDAAGSNAEKYDIISEPLNLAYLKHADSQGLKPDALDDRALHEKVDRGDIVRANADSINLSQYERTNPLALTISIGKLATLKKFLSVVGDINAPELLVWGFRQPYNMAHVALDYAFPYTGNADMATRIKIIELLGVERANFNYVHFNPEFRNYWNPPLASMYIGEFPRLIHHSNLVKLHAAAMLQGADPNQKGSSFKGVDLSEGRGVGKELYSQFMANNVAVTSMRYVEATRALIREQRDIELAQLQARVDQLAAVAI